MKKNNINKNNISGGFATLDAIVATVILTLVLTVVAGWTGTLRLNAIKKEAQFEQNFKRSAMERSLWSYNIDTPPIPSVSE